MRFALPVRTSFEWHHSNALEPTKASTPVGKALLSDEIGWLPFGFESKNRSVSDRNLRDDHFNHMRR